MRMKDDKPFVKRAGIAGLILMFVWGVSLVHWLEFIDRTDLYGTAETISVVFGYLMLFATSGGMLFVFNVTGELEKRIRDLESTRPNRDR